MSFEDKSSYEIGAEFEAYVARIFVADGYVVVPQGAMLGKADGGIDLIALSPRRTVLIQCKRYSPSSLVRENHVNQLFGAAHVFHADHPDAPSVTAVIVATCPFSADAQHIARIGGIHLKTIPAGAAPLPPVPNYEGRPEAYRRCLFALIMQVRLLTTDTPRDAATLERLRALMPGVLLPEVPVTVPAPVAPREVHVTVPAPQEAPPEVPAEPEPPRERRHGILAGLNVFCLLMAPGGVFAVLTLPKPSFRPPLTRVDVMHILAYARDFVLYLFGALAVNGFVAGAMVVPLVVKVRHIAYNLRHPSEPIAHCVSGRAYLSVLAVLAFFVILFFSSLDPVRLVALVGAYLSLFVLWGMLAADCMHDDFRRRK